MRVTSNLAERCCVWRAGAYAVTADRTDICQRRPPRVPATSHEQV